MRAGTVIPILALVLLTTAHCAWAIETKVYIDPANLPDDPGTSYVQTWATVVPNVANEVDRCRGALPGGAEVRCHSSKPAGGSATSGDNWAEAIAVASGDPDQGIAYLETSSNVIKCTTAALCAPATKFGASAAYAQFGWDAEAKGDLAGLGIQVLVNDGLKLVGNKEPEDARVIISVTDLKPTQINSRLIEQVYPKDSAQYKLFVAGLPPPYTVATPKEEYLTIDVELRGGEVVGKEITVNQAEAKKKCPEKVHREKASKDCTPDTTLLKPAEFVDPCKEFGGHHCDVKDEDRVSRKSHRISLPLWIDMPERKQPLSVGQLYCMRHKKDAADVAICRQAQ
jgi:hypothetical protein